MSYTPHHTVLARLPALLVVAVAAIAAGCDDDDDNFVSTDDASVRVIHAAADAPAVTVNLDDDVLVSDLEFTEGSAFDTVDAGTYDLTVDASTPSGETTVIDVPAFVVQEDTDYTVLAVGEANDASLDALVVSNPDSAVSSGQARIQLVPAAPDAPAVAVYLTEPGADLAAATPSDTLSFGENSDLLDVPAGSYQVRITVAGDPGTVVYDGGTLVLDAGDDLLLAAVANTGAGPAPVSLLVNDGTSQSSVLDVATTADVRAGFVSPDAPAVDLIFDGDLANPQFNAGLFPDVTAYSSVAPDDYQLSAVDDATQGTTYFTSDLNLAAGQRYSILAVGPLASVEPLILTDDNRSIGTESRVRVVHAAPTAGAVDIYVQPTGTDINTVTPTYANVAFKADTGFASLAAGSYDLTVTPAGLKTPVAASSALTTENGDVFTVIARDNVGGGAPFSLIVEDETD